MKNEREREMTNQQKKARLNANYTSSRERKREKNSTLDEEEGGRKKRQLAI